MPNAVVAHVDGPGGVRAPWCECPRREVERRCRCRGCRGWVRLTARQDAELLLALAHFFADAGDEVGRQRYRRSRGRKRPWSLEEAA
jgi:hypothetical protein